MSARARWVVVVLAFLVLLGGLVYSIHLARTARSETSREAIARQAGTEKVLQTALASLCRSNTPRDAALVAVLQQFGVKVRTSKEDCGRFATTGKLTLPLRTAIPTVSQLRGLPGQPGAQGKPGSQGLRGVRGIAGQRGPAGAVGPAGPSGPAGAPGQDGAPGSPGPKGDDGPRGVPGSDANTAALQGQVADLAQALAALNAIVGAQQQQIAALQAAQPPQPIGVP